MEMNAVQMPENKQSITAKKQLEWVNSLDPDEVELTLKMNGDIAYVDGEVVGEEETETTTYILTKNAQQAQVDFDQKVKLSVNDGSDSSTITFAPTVFVAKYKYTKLQDQNGQCCMSKKDKVASLTPE